MRLIWSSRALSDLARLFEFLAPSNRRAAARTLREFRSGARKLLEYPRLGERVDEMESREVRRIFVRDYELRYEVVEETIYVVRIWHTRENR
ncbi:MAG: type II toxin-antitoxin system RelE/ParE family toxin [Devosia sp.]